MFYRILCCPVKYRKKDDECDSNGMLGWIRGDTRKEKNGDDHIESERKFIKMV